MRLPICTLPAIKAPVSLNALNNNPLPVFFQSHCAWFINIWILLCCILVLFMFYCERLLLTQHRQLPYFVRCMKSLINKLFIKADCLLCGQSINVYSKMQKWNIVLYYLQLQELWWIIKHKMFWCIFKNAFLYQWILAL